MTTRNQDKQQLKSLVKETIQELLSDDTFINKITKTICDKVEQKIMELEETVKTMAEKTALLEKHVDVLQQNEKINNICIYGLKVLEGKTLSSMVTQVINANSRIELIEADLHKCYRIGKEENLSGKPAPVIIKCKDFGQKMAILKSFKVKDKSMFVAEDLTFDRRKLLREAKEKLGSKMVWTYRGSIYTKVNENKLILHSRDDILKYVGIIKNK